MFAFFGIEIFVTVLIFCLVEVCLFWCMLDAFMFWPVSINIYYRQIVLCIPYGINRAN